MDAVDLFVDELLGGEGLHAADAASASDEDAYADLEDWYAASFPRLHSSSSFAHMGDAFSGSQRTLAHPPPLRVDEPRVVDAAAALEIELDSVAGDYEIDVLGAAESPPEGRAAPSPALIVISGEAPDLGVSTLREATKDVSIVNDDGSVTGDGDDSELLGFVPKKLVARRAPPEGDARCCDRCRSDLNGKLIVKCALCALRRHLYCFSPPLRQHPALASLAHVPRHKRLPMPKLIAQWRCDACVRHTGGPPSPEATTVNLRVGLPTVKPLSPHRKTTENKPNALATKDAKAASPAKPRAFDWYDFRAEKLRRIESRGESRDEGDDRIVGSELAFYSPTDALLKKTALFWHQHVRQRKRLRAEHAARALRCQVPAKRPLLVKLSPRAATEVAAANQQHEQRTRAEQDALFDDATLYPFNDPRPVFHTLRRRPLPVVDDRASVTDEERDRLVEEERHREALETQRMAAEDDDAPTPAQAARMARRRAIAATIIAKDPSVLGLYLAARIIERVCIRWRRTARHREAAVAAERACEQHELELMRAEESADRMRRERARVLVGRLRCQVRFLLVMVGAHRRVQVKRELVLLLNDAQEDAQLVKDCERLARRRIERFFLRRVRRYVALKKRMMARRLLRWWKRRHYTHAFRSLAVVARLHHRDRAAQRIQRAFRQYRVYAAFKLARERHLLRRLGRVLRGWLMRRVIRKEHERVAVYDAAVAVGVSPPPAEDAPLSEILCALGLFLYGRSDFWNGAAVLERLARREHGAVDGTARVALAYCHHMAWYASYDELNVARAEETYRELLTQRGGEPVDAFLLHELALVLMHRDDLRGSLAVLARLVELFRDDDNFPLWLLLAGVQLQHVGQHEQSAAYLGYLIDLALPPPYEERDALALCAISYEKHGAARATEAWRAAIRLWSMEKKLVGTVSAMGAHPVDAKKGAARSRLSALRKWELLVDLARRADGAGHYLVVCRVLLHAVERVAPLVGDGGDDDAAFELERQRAWWSLGDAFRHLGKLDLYVEATARSRASSTDEDRRAWRAQAETLNGSFARDLATLTVAQHVAQIRSQYEQHTTGEDADCEDTY